MIRLYTLSSFLLFSISTFAQQPFKSIPEASAVPADVRAEHLDFRRDLIPQSAANRPAPLQTSRIADIKLPGLAGVKVLRDQQTGTVFALKGRPEKLSPAIPGKADAYAYLNLVAPILGLSDAANELVITEEKDTGSSLHLRFGQRFRGLPVYPADARLHANGSEGFDLFTGRLAPIPTNLNILPAISDAGARAQVRGSLDEQWIDLPAKHLDWISGPQLEAELMVYAPEGQSPTLAWKLEARPNLLRHYVYLLDAVTGEELNVHSHLCGLHGNHSGESEADFPASFTLPRIPQFYGTVAGDRAQNSALPPPPDGPYTTTRQNLYDQNETINTFSLQDTFYLLDGSRDMFTDANNTIDGFLLTYDGFGGSPQRNDFNPGIAISLTNNDWTQTAVSVHANSGVAYQYFLDRFNRNSIDGIGGNVYSFMNINETDGTQMDNAFWNGRALFYGNGSQAFSRLPRGLDVAGHEMAHGVIQSTADLVYQEQPGAMNESFADIFGYLVEGETGDYQIGEDVVRTQVFTSGAMRNLQNPNNGAAGPSDFRWQPAHMDEYQDLPVNADNDNGGVHINSGIPNRAFYLFSSNPAVGDARAEQVYYRALDVYLTRSARFEDLRLAVVQAAEDLYGSDVVAAANAAFDGVGIGSTESEGGDYTIDLETNGGDRFLLLTDEGQNALFLANEAGELLNNPLETVGISSRPSLTDDGSVAVFIDDQNRVRVYNFDSNELTFLENNPQTIWRNVAVSKGGRRLALTTTDNNNQVLVFDLVSGTGRNFDLFNPTTIQGISTGDVVMADALEWEPGGESLMYDALSRLDDGLEFWDIGFLEAWNTDNEDFGDGTIFKLFSNLPEETSIGNPTFSRNSPYIIAFEEVDFSTETFTLVGANIETGRSATIFTNGRVNYPNFGIDDDRICFDATSGGAIVLGVRPLAEDKISPGGDAVILVEGGHWGTFFATGERNLDTAIEGPVVQDDRVKVYPTVTSGLVTIEGPAFNDERQLQLFDANGRLVWSRSQVQGEVDLAGLPGGAYFLAVPVERGTTVRRIIIK